MSKKIRETLRFDLETCIEEFYRVSRGSSYRTDQKQEALDTLNSFIRVYNYYTKPKDHITLFQILDGNRVENNSFDEGL